ncbi:MAG: cation:proton antiporter [Nocardioidaceae bacterium]
MSTDQILLGTGLIIALAVGSQILAARLRIPAIIVLLPVGFLAGAATDVVNPDKLLGPAFSPLVSLAVAVILYDAGLALDLKRLRGQTRRVVVRLIGFGVVITVGLAAVTAALLLGLSRDAALQLGAILVVSGPTVVGPLLSFVRPTERLQRILAWEGSLIDPVGGILSALVLNAIVSRTVGQHPGEQVLQFLASVGIGVLGGLVGGGLLWLVLVRLRPGEVLEAGAQLAAVVLVAAVCDAVRDDSGLIAAILVGLLVANLEMFDLPARRPFLETVVQLILGILFVSISATVTPASLQGLVLPTLGLVAVLMLVARPVLTVLATVRTDLPRQERMFIAWMAPRGIVAAATASSFSATLVAQGVAGAGKILPVTFLVIVATVATYGLTAVPVARRLGVTRAARSRPLVVGGAPWVLALAGALRTAGLDVVMWAPREEQRERIRGAGIELAPGELLAAATGRGAELEGITSVLLLSDEDDFNALASVVLDGTVDERVYRLNPPAEGAVAPYIGTERLFGNGLTGAEIARRCNAGAGFRVQPGEREVAAGDDLLFLVRAEGRLVPVVEGQVPAPEDGDVAVLLGTAAARRGSSAPSDAGRPVDRGA